MQQPQPQRPQRPQQRQIATGAKKCVHACRFVDRATDLVAQHAAGEPRRIPLPAALQQRRVQRAREQKDARIPQAPALGLARAAGHAVELARRPPVHRMPRRRLVVLYGRADGVARHQRKEVRRGWTDYNVIVEVKHARIFAQKVREEW